MQLASSMNYLTRFYVFDELDELSIGGQIGHNCRQRMRKRQLDEK